MRSAPAPGPPDGRQHAVRFSVTAPSYCGNPSKPLPEAAADSCFSSSGSLPASHAARIHSPSASVICRSAELPIYRPVGLVHAEPPSHSCTALLSSSSSSSSSSPPAAAAASPPPPVLLSSNCVWKEQRRRGWITDTTHGLAGTAGQSFVCADAPYCSKHVTAGLPFFSFLNGVLHDGCVLLNRVHPVPKRLSHTHIQTLDCIYKH